MISEKEIFERLMKGENLDDIMNEITGEVNKAIEAKKKADAEAEEAKRKAEEAAALIEMEKVKREAAMVHLDAVLNGIAGILAVYGYANEASEIAGVTEEDKNDVLDSIDSIMEMTGMLKMLGGTTFPLGGSKPKVEKKVEKPVAKKQVIEVDPFEAFFKKFGI
jgi:hypothetical protein